MIRTALLLTMTVAVAVPLAQDKPDPLQTRPERTNFEETSRLDDITAFLSALAAKSPLVRVQTFGTTEEGRPMPFVTLSNPAVSRPVDRPAGRPVVFLLANIHGGAVPEPWRVASPKNTVLRFIRAAKSGILPTHNSHLIKICSVFHRSERRRSGGKKIRH